MAAQLKLTRQEDTIPFLYFKLFLQAESTAFKSESDLIEMWSGNRLGVVDKPTQLGPCFDQAELSFKCVCVKAADSVETVCLQMNDGTYLSPMNHQCTEVLFVQ